MQNNKVLKKLLAVSVVAAMFSAFGVHAQTSSTGSQGSTQGGSSAGNQSMDGASQGRDQSSGSSSGTSGTSGSTGTSAGDTAGQGSAGTSSSGAGQSSMGASGSSASGQGASGSSAAGQGGMAASTGGAAAGGSLGKGDQKILMEMAVVNIDEIEAGKLALSKSQNDQVKSFAQQMVDDHTKALADVQQVAQSKSVTLPTEPDSKHKALLAKLEKLSGAAFDKTYMSNAGLADHKKVLSMLKQDDKRAKDPDVKALAEKMMPVVEQHLKAAQQLPAMKTGTTSGK